MKRRSYLGTELVGAFGMRAVKTARPIAFRLDLAVDPAKETEMLRFFETESRPAAAQQTGSIDLKMLKLTATFRGPATEGANLRFVLQFASEELRKKWVASAMHQKLWQRMESMLTSKNYTRLMYDVY